MTHSNELSSPDGESDDIRRINEDVISTAAALDAAEAAHDAALERLGRYLIERVGSDNPVYLSGTATMVGVKTKHLWTYVPARPIDSNSAGHFLEPGPYKVYAVAPAGRQSDAIVGRSTRPEARYKVPLRLLRLVEPEQPSDHLPLPRDAT